MEDPDAGLVLLTGQGDAQAASRLVARHLPRMTALARRMLGDSAEAEDVAQDVFLKVWTQAKRWQPGAAKFETWLHRVAINACLDRLRKKRGVGLDEIDERVDPAPNPEQALAANQTSRQVDEALQTLPERQRAAISLCHYQGLTNIEAASALEISVEALESLLSRGRRALKEKLSHLSGAGAPGVKTARA